MAASMASANKGTGSKGSGSKGTGSKGSGSHGSAPATQTDWLAPATPSQLQKQAVNTISKAYAPQNQNLNQEAKRQQAISDKRASDNKYYRAWLDTQMGALQTHADAANVALLQQENLIRQQNAQLYNGNAPAGTPGGAEINPGVVNALQQRNLGLIDNMRTQGVAGVSNQTDSLGATRANNYGLIAASESKRQSDLNTALTGIANNRAKLKTAETGDIAKEVARLTGVEIQKQQFNDNYNATLKKLNITAANNAQQSADRNRAIDATLRGQDLQKAESDRTYQLNVKKFGKDFAKDQYQRDHGLGPYSRGTGGAKNQYATPAAQNNIFTKIDKYNQLYKDLKGQGFDRNQIWQWFISGGSYKSKDGKSTIHVPALGNVQLANAAFDLNEHGGLTQGSIDALHNSFHVHIGNRYQLAPNPANPNLPPY